ncbi:actin-like ATPase domain-containing protein [Aspergillus sclerotioniger CBS 115572]|uniref:Actin-like ATPase domain-containing protein n=1 Tax=Aspergillus sclerotioniger CBS 115572 TaxID=1450535 RepID=A0A317VA85_9EURO|nr:actin-like ATPase domain-containing protein [Aspergillus sclerotioniger CBS 115572]PWY71136.1 actin-like ATPase domain-containing protein [Aspergillus sclerotioniger CBS 115572]
MTGMSSIRYHEHSITAIDQTPIVIDNGHLLRDKGQKEWYLGDEVISELQYLKEDGVRWELRYKQVQKIWHDIITNKLHILIDSERPILLTESFLYYYPKKEDTAEWIFESLNPPSLCLYPSPILSLHATCRTTGLVIQAGHRKTDVVAIQDGLPIKWRQTHTAGDELTHFLIYKLRERGYELYTGVGYEHTRRIKETFCYVPDWDEVYTKFHESPQAFQRTYTLPDGQTITVDEELFHTGMAFLDPCTFGTKYPSVDSIVYNTIMNDDKDLQAVLTRNIVLAGGSANLPGIAEILKGELDNYYGFRSEPILAEIHTPSNPHLLAWTGGSMMAEHSSLKERWISRQEFEEFGHSIVKRKGVYQHP